MKVVRRISELGYRIAAVPRLPLGLSIIAGMLAMIGVGSIGVGIYALVAGGSISLWAAATGLAAGPAILYLAFQLVRFATWTWRTLVVALVMLALSSIARLVSAPGIVGPPILEILVEVGTLYYLSRMDIREGFRNPVGSRGG